MGMLRRRKKSVKCKNSKSISVYTPIFRQVSDDFGNTVYLIGTLMFNLCVNFESN